VLKYEVPHGAHCDPHTVNFVIGTVIKPNKGTIPRKDPFVGELSLPWRRNAILAKYAGCSHFNLVISVSHDTTWPNTAGECCAQTLNDARLSPAMYPSGSIAGRVLFMKNNKATSSRSKLVGAEMHACERAPEAPPRPHGPLRGLARHGLSAQPPHPAHCLATIRFQCRTARTLGTGRSLNLETVVVTVLGLSKKLVA
jgi:hypothetical protein